MGVIIFAVILVYLIGISLTYVFTHKISTYEVTYGSIIDDTYYSGLAIREEEIFTSSGSGYLQYYYSEGTRVSYDTIIYTLSNSSISTDNGDSTATYSISSSDQSEMISTIQAYNSAYDNISFDNSYDLLLNIETLLNSNETDAKLNELSELDATDSSLNIYRAYATGLISYSIDNYESITLDNFTEEDFDKTKYSYTTTMTGNQVSTTSAIYKLLTNEEWYIVIEIADDDIETYTDMSKVEINFLSDGESTTASFELVKQAGNTYGIITLNTGMVRYMNERFIDIEIVLEDLEGYKVPISSIVTKEFYAIPEDYVTQGGANGSNGLLFTGDNNEATFEEIDIYYKDTEYVYLLVEDIGIDRTIIQEESSELYVLSDIIEMDGVYSVNKGYAEYKVVTILASGLEYYILDDSMSYSISNYDHIALYGDSVSENAIIN